MKAAEPNMRRIVRTQRLLAELGHADPLDALEELRRLRARDRSAEHQDAQRLGPEGAEPGGDSHAPKEECTQQTTQLPAPAAGEREAFEAWLMSLGAAERGATLQKLGAEYLDGRTRSAWQAWQARAAAPQRER